MWYKFGLKGRESLQSISTHQTKGCMVKCLWMPDYCLIGPTNPVIELNNCIKSQGQTRVLIQGLDKKLIRFDLFHNNPIRLPEILSGIWTKKTSFLPKKNIWKKYLPIMIRRTKKENYLKLQWKENTVITKHDVMPPLFPLIRLELMKNIKLPANK